MTPQEIDHLEQHLINEHGVHPCRLLRISEEDDWLRSATPKPIGLAIIGPLGAPFAVWYEQHETNYGVPTDRVFERIDGRMRGGYQTEGL